MVIRSDDVNAVKLLKDKIAKLEEAQALMRAVNAYYRKNKTLEGCPDLSDSNRREIERRWESGWYREVPFPPYELSNNNANIRRLKDRLKSIETEKLRRECADLRGDDGIEDLGWYRVIENRDANRIQIEFDGKPDADVRSVLKNWGFKWAPSQGVWQRMLNGNGRYAVKMVKERLEGIGGKG